MDALSRNPVDSCKAKVDPGEVICDLCEVNTSVCLACPQPVSASDNKQEEASGAGVASADMEQMCVDSHFLSTCQDNVGTCACSSSEADLKTTGVGLLCWVVL